MLQTSAVPDINPQCGGTEPGSFSDMENLSPGRELGQNGQTPQLIYIHIKGSY